MTKYTFKVVQYPNAWKDPAGLEGFLNIEGDAGYSLKQIVELPNGAMWLVMQT